MNFTRLTCCDEEEPESENTCWAAEVDRYSDHIHLHQLDIIRETPKGVWLKRSGSFTKPFWRSDGRASRTKEDAMWQLLRRKRSHVKHAKRRAEEAERQLGAVQKRMREQGLIKETQEPKHIPFRMQWRSI